MVSFMQAVVDAAPAGGAAVTQVVLGTAISLVVVGAIAYVGIGHRSGRVTLLARAGEVAGPYFRARPWGAVPLVVALAAFLVAGLGFVWDVALHIDQGRDSGPFGTPAHYLLLLGIYGFVAAGFFAVAMADEADRRPGWIRLREGWHAPPAALAMLACAVFSMSGFPLDDIWHNVFGQDVTLWGPTHLMMISGGLFTFLALMLVVREARGGRRSAFLAVQGAGIVLVGLTVAYQQEFAYGVPQFRLLFQPTLIAFSAAVALVGVRIGAGRGAALATALWSIAIMAGLTIAVGPVLGEATHHFPLYLAEALLVEGAALRLRGLRLAVVAGALIGSVGTLAELGWSHVWMPIAWPAHLLPEAIARSVVIGIAGAVIGAFVAAAMRGRAPGWRPAAAALAVTVLSLLSLLPTHAPPLRGTLTLEDNGHVSLSVPPAAARGADWLYAMAWQGGEHRSVASPMDRLAPGLYLSRDPMPVGGTWKTFVRLHRGDEMRAIAVHMPADSAIPAPAVPARPHVTRAFAGDRELLQRERKPDTPAWLFTAASAAVAAATLALLVLLGWVLVRVPDGERGARPRGSRRRRLVASASHP
jgi:hypothetical protein